MRIRHLLLTLAAFLVAQDSMAAAPKIWLDGIEVSIGMRRAALLANLHDHKGVCPSQNGISVEPIACDHLFIQRKRPPFTLVGSVSFSGGTVSNVQKYWNEGFADINPTEFTGTLFALLQSAMGDEKHLPAIVSISESRGVSTTIREITIRVNGRAIHISGFEGVRNEQGKLLPPQTTLTESIGAP